MDATLRGLLLVLALGGCRGDASQAVPVADAPPVALAAAPVVEFAGCDGGERRANTCILRASAEGPVLRLWVEGAELPRVTLDGVALTPTAPPQQVDGGWQMVVPVPAAAAELAVVREGAVPWTLRVLPAPPTPALDRIHAGLPPHGSAGRTPAIHAALQAIERDLPTMSTFERAAALYLATQLAWDSGGDAAAYGRRALAAALELDDATAIVASAQLLVHMLDADREANWVLDLETLYAANVADADAQTGWRDDVANQALRMDDIGGGLAALAAGASLARRVGLRDHEVGTASRAVAYLAIYGREAELDAAIARLLSLTGRADGRLSCDETVALVNVSSSLLSAQRGDGPAEAEALLQRVLHAFEAADGGCAVGDNGDMQLAHLVAHANLVFGAQRRGDWAQVAERLAWFDGREIPGVLAPVLALHRAELAFARGELAAARALLGRMPERSADPQDDWRALVLRGRVEAAAGDRAAAIEAFRAAEAYLDALVMEVGVDQGREGVGFGLHAGAAEAIAALAADGRAAEAAQIARRSRARALRPVGRAARLAALDDAQRRAWSAAIGEYESIRNRLATELTEAWTLPSDAREAMLRGHVALREQMHAAHNRAFEILAAAKVAEGELASPRAGELWLSYHPAPQGWFGIAITDRTTTVRALGALPALTDDAALAATLIEPFAAELADAERIKILAMGELLEVAFHELPFADGALIDHAPLAWGLDVGGRTAIAPAQRALVVADPASRAAGVGALPRSRDEGLAVAQALGGRGMEVVQLLGDEATVPAVLERLPAAAWFHYAGHGISAGATGWDSALPLAGEAQLGVRDVLAASAVPRAVVLSGCATAAVLPGTSAGGVSLATAFILAGSEFVIGSATDVADDEAADMSATLYGVKGPGDGQSMFRAAVRDGRARARAWTRGLRLWTP